MRAGLAKFNIAPEAGEGNFPWDMYADGWNGKSFKANGRIKVKNRTDKVYSHDEYAQGIYNKFMKLPVPESKEVRKDTVVKISDLQVINGNTVMASVNNGANNIIIDLEKEAKFFNTISFGDQHLNKETFVQCLQDAKLKQDILGMNLSAKVGTDVAKASIWDGYVMTLTDEMRGQVTKNNKAYMGTIVSANRGGFVVDIMGVVKAFMPGSVAASNRLTDYESMIGKEMEVMVESYEPNAGFVVSRKKFLNAIKPIKLRELAESLKQNQDTVFTGHITGSNQFGIYVELDEYLTGMIHKSLASDESRDAMRREVVATQNGQKGTVIVPGTEIQVYVHKIENNRIVLSDVPSSERDEVIARREAEDEKEKMAHVAGNRSREPKD